MNSDGTPVLNENAAPPEGDGADRMVDNSHANGAAEVVAPPLLNGLNAGAGMVLNFKPV